MEKGKNYKAEFIGCEGTVDVKLIGFDDETVSILDMELGTLKVMKFTRDSVTLIDKCPRCGEYAGVEDCEHPVLKTVKACKNCEGLIGK